MKIVSRGNTIATPDYYKKRLKARRRQIIIFIVGLLTLLVGLVLLLRLEQMKIKNVLVIGVDEITQTRVQELVERRLNERYLWLIPKGNALIYPRGELRERLHQEFPRFDSVSFALEGFNDLSISITERRPFALYCQSSGCFFIDKGAFIFAPAPVFSEGVYFIYRGVEEVAEPIGEVLMPLGEFDALSQFVSEFPSLSATATAVPKEVLISGDKLELLLDSGAKVSWGRGQDLGKLQVDLKSFLSSPEIKAISDFWDKVATLDLKTENKVFYTFK